MHPPPGYSVPDGHVYRLRRSLYGLKQARPQASSLVLGLNASPQLSLLLILLAISMTPLFSFTLPPVVVPLFFFTSMICSSRRMTMSILPLLRPVLGPLKLLSWD
jgi:hypothetical protein